jgi:hypothetical protein
LWTAWHRCVRRLADRIVRHCRLGGAARREVPEFGGVAGDGRGDTSDGTTSTWPFGQDFCRKWADNVSAVSGSGRHIAGPPHCVYFALLPGFDLLGVILMPSAQHPPLLLLRLEHFVRGAI